MTTIDDDDPTAATPRPTPSLTPEQLAAKKKADNRQANIWGAAIVGILILCCGGWAITHQSKSDPEGDRSNTAITACEDSVRNQLKAPSTAKFSDERYTDDDPSWRVTGNVDAENSFGAMIRNSFSCTLTRNGNDMVTTSANVNGN